MFDAPNLYENDGFYEDTDYEDEYIADDIDYIADDEEDENALWGDEDEPERKKLKRELRAEALVRLEDSARTQRDFENVIAWWDRLDANRERRERYQLLFLCSVRLFSSTRIAKIRNQSDRNIRKVRGTMLKKIRKKLLPALLDKAEKQQSMTLLEKDFLEEYGRWIDSRCIR